MPACKYSFSFIGAYLRPELGRIMAETFLSLGDWNEVRQYVLKNNALQSRTKSSLIRMERELRQRIRCLTKKELSLLATGNGDERASMSWLSVLKYSRFIRDFAVEFLCAKLADMDYVLRMSDFNNFIESRTTMHPEVESLKESSRNKIRLITYRMLLEAGMAFKKGKDLTLVKPALSTMSVDVIVNDSPCLLAGFLWTEEEIKEVKTRI